MNLHALRLFHTVARLGSVTRAAEELRLSQPAVTIQVRNLEQELGLTLLAPKGRGVLLTEAGACVAAEARRLFALEEEVEARVAAFREGRTGRLRIAATYLPSNFLLPAWTARFRETHRGVSLSLSTANAQEALRRLTHYEADLAVIGGGPEAASGITRRLLREDPMWFVVPPGHPLAGREASLGELMREPFVLREPGSFTRDMLLSLCRTAHVEPPRISLEMDGFSETLRAVAAGCGAAFASAAEVRPYIERGEVARVFVPSAAAVNPISLCLREGEEPSPTAAAFLSLIEASHPPAGGSP
ncbi:LysR family transcriptional regulator [Paenibacillus mucilaginosus]|uniref:Transcriptional activator of the cysJI operon n=1 Tax=Paenibacillus mucilaginosus (strain KNP414) TaxID=1036673 RepID=F8FGL4_PAEMK|nr:LysR family transcriptional regulator [Paenibacillus mucilaginosus]AEI45391.1 transcriptional activator of the cysJI operon [Paenibacillus mucilaginosus KNP414]MCG7217969.1 LysR family transcriptional regulator [Paenibacillus mucilaginosus]WDM26836.1 LysR family transcriptional regulator [Paenibacillus mucilaginosus]